MFIVQSQTVIGLFLNFEGVVFVSELDDVMYSLSFKELVGKTAQDKAHKVSGFAMMTGLLVLVYRQDERVLVHKCHYSSWDIKELFTISS